MTDRRYNDEEVAAIFLTAAEGPKAPLPHAPSDEGLTLADLQDIGREVGIPPEAVAQAAQSLDQRGRAVSRSFLGLPIGVERTVALNRWLTDEEWEHLGVFGDRRREPGVTGPPPGDPAGSVTDSTVLLLGETGTGKELVARAIHQLSSRKERPLIKVNCGAIAPGLVESELFGHERGAFIGALQRRVGRFELANKGTLFLDEIGELPPESQTRLLRVLQEQEFERVGGSQPIRVDVRLIAATNRDLDVEVAGGRFRADLFYRLSVFPARVPPLRERKDDIPHLVRHFVAHQRRRLGKPIEGVSREGMDRLRRYSWPGNVRELQNVIERACVLASGTVLTVPESLAEGPAHQPADPILTLAEMEKRHIHRALEATGGAIGGAAGAAVMLGINPNTLRSRMEKLGMLQRKR